jgi:hypothetical protein
MSKPSRGAYAVGKKKAKKRPEPHTIAQLAPSAAPKESVQAQEGGNGSPAVSSPVLQFRPKGREAVAARPSSGRAPASAAAKFAQQVVDYSYVYTDLKIIAVLVVSLLVILVVLSAVIH